MPTDLQVIEGQQARIEPPVVLVLPSGHKHHKRDERGEGVISTAISVLVVSALGVAMWLAFSNIFQDVSDKTSGQVEQIGATP